MPTTTRQQLIDYCLRQLGEPVVEVNVDPQQVEDRVDEAMEYFRLYHYEGIEMIYMKHEITQDDITNKWIPIPDCVYGVTTVFPVASGTSTSKSIFDLQYQLRLNDLYDLTSTSVIYYSQVMSHLSLLDLTLNGKTLYRFNRLAGRLYVDKIWTDNMQVGNFLLVQVYRALDPTTTPKMYDEPWLKRYTTALIKKQWGTNLAKFSGLQLPGGVTIDGKALYQEALEEQRALEDEMMHKSAPLDFFLG
jgi:hypothetical protein